MSLLNTFKKEHSIIQEDNTAKLKEHSEHLHRIDSKIGDILKGMEEQNEKIERLFSLHGSMLNRINRIEEVQEGAVKNIQGIKRLRAVSPNAFNTRAAHGHDGGEGLYSSHK